MRKQAIGAAVLFLMVSGCKPGSGGGPGGFRFGPSRDMGAVWRPEPVEMRVYPASRFEREGGASLLSARVELLDAMGDSTKGGGRFHFELLRGDRAAGGPIGQRIYAWDVPVLSLDDQRGHYDAITRTYLFRLAIDDPAVPKGEAILKATLPRADGEELAAERLIAPE